MHTRALHHTMCAALIACLSSMAYAEQDKHTKASPEKDTPQQSTPYTELSKHEEFTNCLHNGKYILVKLHACWCDGCHEVEPAFRHVSHAFSDRVIPVAIDIDNKNFQREVERYVDRGVPTIVLLDENGTELSKQIGSSDAQTLESFVSQHITPSRKRSQAKNKSSETAEQHDIPSITTYEEYKAVMQNNRNVAILLHADWCSPCKMFKPTFKQMSDKRTDIYCCMLNIDQLKADTSLKHELGSHAQNGIPTTLFLQDGIVIKSVTGSYPAESFEKATHDAFGAPPQQKSQQTATTHVKASEPSQTQKQEISGNENNGSQKKQKRRGRRRRR